MKNLEEDIELSGLLGWQACRRSLRSIVGSPVGVDASSLILCLALLAHVPSPVSGATVRGGMMGVNTWLLHPFADCIVGGTGVGRHTEKNDIGPRRTLSPAYVKWKTMMLFDVEERLDDVAQAEATFKAAQVARARRVPVTGSSDTEGALNDIVNAYMGNIHKSRSIPSRAISDDNLLYTSRQVRECVVKHKTHDERLGYVPEEHLAAAGEEPSARAVTSPPAPLRSMVAAAAPVVSEMPAEQEKAWRDACLKALIHRGDGSASQKRAKQAKLSRSKSAPDLRLLGGNVMNWAGERVRKWGQLASIPHRKAPSVEEVIKGLEKVVEGAQRARKSILNAGALDTLFLALAVLADGAAAPMQQAGLRGGAGFDLDELGRHAEEEEESVNARSRKRFPSIRKHLAAAMRRIPLARRLVRPAPAA